MTLWRALLATNVVLLTALLALLAAGSPPPLWLLTPMALSVVGLPASLYLVLAERRRRG